MRRYEVVLALMFAAAASGADSRLTHDDSLYVSAYTLGTGVGYTDAVLRECSISRGRQNEPAIALDPRNPNVLVGSSNDYCGVYAGSATVAAGPVWLGYYRSENGGADFVSSLVPGYPGDTSPFAALAKVRTAGAGDPVIAWDAHGRAFFGSESSDDPAGTKKTFGDVWVATFENPDGAGGATVNDGKKFAGSVIVAKGSSAPNLLGVFHDKTAIEADRTGGACDANVYFAWARFNGNGANNIYFSRSTDHGRTWSSPQLLTPQTQSVQGPDIGVTANGHVYVTYRQYGRVSNQPTGIGIVKSTDCGRTFSRESLVTTILPSDAEDVLVSGGPARDCGDFDSACQSGYTFFRRDSTPRSTADQSDPSHEFVYIVYEGSKPNTVANTGTTFGTLGRGQAAQAGIYFTRYNGANGTATSPVLIDDQPIGHQVFPDISADGGVLYTIWWDSRNDINYSPIRPIGNDPAGKTGPSVDVWSAKSTDLGATWGQRSRLSDQTSNPNYEQFADRTVPFAGDYLWVTSLGGFAYATWTDWRDTVSGTDPREVGSPDFADVKQCRTQTSSGAWGPDTCPHSGGLDQNIYGAGRH